MGFKEFMAEVRSRGVASRSHFMVQLNPPAFMLSSSELLTTVIPLFCEQAMFPEFMAITQMIKDGGLNREVVYDKTYGTVSMTFTCDQAMLIKRFFDQWVQAPVVRTGGIFQYPQRYIVDELRIYQLSSKKQATYEVVLKNVYPKVVNDIFMNSGDRSISSFQVVFAYESWSSKVISSDMSPLNRAMDGPVSIIDGVKTKPKFMVDIAQIMDYAKMNKDTARSMILSRGSQALSDIFAGNAPSILNPIQGVADNVTGAISGVGNSITSTVNSSLSGSMDNLNIPGGIQIT